MIDLGVLGRYYGQNDDYTDGDDDPDLSRRVDLNGDGVIDVVDQGAYGLQSGEALPVADPGVTHPRFMSFRNRDLTSLATVIALCPFGHQGLMHDEEIALGGSAPGSGGGLIHNRARTLHPGVGRFMQRDPKIYVDGLNAYSAYHMMRGGLDPTGEQMIVTLTGPPILTPGFSGSSQSSGEEALKYLALLVKGRETLKRTKPDAFVCHCDELAHAIISVATQVAVNDILRKVRDRSGHSLSTLLKTVKDGLDPLSNISSRTGTAGTFYPDQLGEHTQPGELAAKINDANKKLDRAQKVVRIAEGLASGEVGTGDVQGFANVLDLSATFVPDSSVAAYIGVLSESLTAVHKVVEHWNTTDAAKHNLLEIKSTAMSGDFRVRYPDAVFGINWAKELLDAESVESKFDRECPKWPR